MPTFTGTRDGDTITGEFTQGGQAIPVHAVTMGDNLAETCPRQALEGHRSEVIEQALEDYAMCRA